MLICSTCFLQTGCQDVEYSFPEGFFHPMSVILSLSILHCAIFDDVHAHEYILAHVDHYRQDMLPKQSHGQQ